MNKLPKKSKQRKVDLSYWIYRVIKETGWTVEELKKCPIPTFWLIVDEISQEDKASSGEK